VPPLREAPPQRSTPIAPRPTPVAPTTARPTPIPEDGDDASGVLFVQAGGKTVRAGESLPVILAVTRDATGARDLAQAVAGRAVVRPVVDLVDLAEAIEDHRGELPIVLFDCGHAPFHLESVATFAGELPCGSWLALIDGTADDERTARGFAGNTLTIVRLGAALGSEAIAKQCLSLFL
jgi:hypothetical protein